MTQEKTPVSRYRRYTKSVDSLVAKPKNRAYTTVVFSILAIALLAWYAIRPTINTILHLRREIRDKQVVNQQMEEKIVNLIQAQSTYRTIEPKLSLLDTALPVDPQILSLASQLRNLTSTNGVVLSSLTAGSTPLITEEKKLTKVKSTEKSIEPPQDISPTAPKDHNFIEIPLTASMTGPYEGTIGVLTGIEGMRRILYIANITLTPASQGSQPTEPGGGEMQLTVQLISYYAPRQ